MAQVRVALASPCAIDLKRLDVAPGKPRVSGGRGKLDYVFDDAFRMLQRGLRQLKQEVVFTTRLRSCSNSLSPLRSALSSRRWTISSNSSTRVCGNLFQHRVQAASAGINSRCARALDAVRQGPRPPEFYSPF